LIKGPDIKEGLLNRVEMAFRGYDPCLACATHALPGDMPLVINLRDKDRNIIKTLKRE
jgi:coenzyme F420-reducing hydrogenase alpha subunit